jgi:hypothetical protein
MYYNDYYHDYKAEKSGNTSTYSGYSGLAVGLNERDRIAEEREH